MRPRPRPASSNGGAPRIRGNAPVRPAPPSRKTFNCIVDDTALVAGVKKSTRNGIRQWVKNGQIRLFVPLHALDQLRRQMSGGSRHADDVRETLQWLDEATTKHPDVVTLQGADETYERWAEVERFTVPRTLFSEHYLEHEPGHDEESASLPELTANKLSISQTEGEQRASNSSKASDRSDSLSPSSLRSTGSRSISPESPPTSPAKTAISPVTNLATLATSTEAPLSSSTVVPQQLQDLFNYILWRIHQELDPAAALESFIFLCNDPNKVHFAKGFDIKTKRLEQLREAVGREDRDFRNRQLVANRENQNAVAALTKPSQEASDAEEVVFRPSTPKAPAAMLHKQQQQSNLIDPNTFGGRGPQPFAPVHQSPITPKSPCSPTTPSFRGSPRAAKTGAFSPRGSGRGSGRGNLRGNARGRGNHFATGRGGFAMNETPEEVAASSGQIDPNSFARSDGRGSFHGGRDGRKLWVPT